MNIKPSMSKRTVKTITGLALVAVTSVIAVSLLMTGAGGATAFNTNASDDATQHIPIPAQYSEQCSNGVAVPNPGGNAGLVGDCAALLAAKGALEGTNAILDWSADVAISDWEGVTIADNRVSRLDLGRTWGTPPSDKLTGRIPAELGNLAKLRDLRLHNNQLTGTIPAELGNLANLMWVDLYANQLTGVIPAELGNLAKLNQLSLSSNQLTGAIPVELGNLANLRGLHLHDNRLAGEIPAELGTPANLRQLYLSSNQLTGAIPVELGNLAELANLSLASNQLTGEIPAELGNLANLNQLSLSGNQLTGAIPAELGNLDKLLDLSLSGNRLTGEIPAELGNLANLGTLHLHRNQLTGAIPTELGNLAKLHQLYLHRNQLTGAIPAWLGNLANLGYLTLHANQLTGCIPRPVSEILDDGEIQRIGLPICAATTAATPTPTATSAPLAIATPTPTATSVPGGRATPVATLTPTATSVASSDVMDRLTALERQVAEIPDLRRRVAEIPYLKNQIAVLATKVARLAATVTPTPTATPARAIDASPTPSPTPTSVAGTSATCVERLAGNGRVNGRWAHGCLTANSPDSRTYYARFYTFTLYAASEVTITLASVDATPYLFLLEGEGTGGEVKRENGVADADSVTITAVLQAGAYTIEASTYSAETGGDFRLELEIAR